MNAITDKSIAAGPRLLSIESTCRALDCSRPTVYRLIALGELRRVYLRGGRIPRILAEDVERLAATPEAEGAAG